MKRRAVTTLLATAAIAAPLAVRAQRPEKVLRVGTAGLPRSLPHWQAFERRMAELGYQEGRNFAFEHLEARDPENFLPLYQELAARKVDIFLVVGTERAIQSAIAVADTKPVVMVAIDYDPLAQGYIANLARTDSNVTGVFFRQIELTTKRLQLFKDAFPDMRAATVLWQPRSADQWEAARAAASPLGLELAGVELRDRPFDLDAAFAGAPPEGRGHLFVVSSGPFYAERARLADFALRTRAASMFAAREWVDAGGLLSFGPSNVAMFGRVAEYVDRIARGTPPSQLPVEQPTTFEFVVNLRTADALGVTIPPSVIARADALIE